MNVRKPGRIVPVAVTIAVGVNSDGRRELLGMAIGVPGAATFRLDFLRSLTRRALAWNQARDLPCPVAPRRRPTMPKVTRLTDLLNAVEHEVMVYMDFPREHRAKIHSTNPIDCLYGELKGGTDVIGIFRNEEASTRLIGAMLLEPSSERAIQRARYMTLETTGSESENQTVSLPAVAA